MVAASAVGTWLFLQYALKHGNVDKPNHRSSHTTPKPRGGGIIIISLATTLWIVSLINNLLPLKQGMAFLLAGSLVALAGYFDDKGHVSRRARIVAQLVATFLAIMLLHPLPALTITSEFSISLNNILLLPVAGILMIWLINLYNFMDGIDAIAASEAIIVTSTTAITLLYFGNTKMAIVLVFFSCIITGFLIWNWPPSKLFMGDSGSTYIGLILAIFAIITSESLSLWYWVIILGTFIGDASWTLLVRMITGQNWRDGHRLHGYQKHTKSETQHRSTSLLYAAVTLFWLYPLAVFTVVESSYSMFIAAIAYTPIVLFCYYKKAGIPSSDLIA